MADFTDRPPYLSACQLSSTDVSFVSYDPNFESVTGASAKARLVATTSKDFGGSDERLFHEAGVYIPELAEIWITSNILSATDGSKHIDICRLGFARDAVSDAQPELQRRGSSAVATVSGVAYASLNLSQKVPMANGGTAVSARTAQQLL